MTSPAEWALWGPQFTLSPPLPPGRGDAGGWLPLGDILRPEVFEARMARTRRGLARMGGAGAGDARVAASLAQMGVVARLLPAAMGLLVLDLDAEPLLQARGWWRPGDEPVFGLAASLGAPGSDGRSTGLDDSIIGALATLVAGHWHVSPQTLWGNVASVVHASTGIIARTTPQHAMTARAVAMRLLDAPGIDPRDRAVDGWSRRHSCCLLYRATPDLTPVCGDCVLVPAGRRAL